MIRSLSFSLSHFKDNSNLPNTIHQERERKRRKERERKVPTSRHFLLFPTHLSPLSFSSYTILSYRGTKKFRSPWRNYLSFPLFSFSLILFLFSLILSPLNLFLSLLLSLTLSLTLIILTQNLKRSQRIPHLLLPLSLLLLKSILIIVLIKDIQVVRNVVIKE